DVGSPYGSSGDAVERDPPTSWDELERAVDASRPAVNVGRRRHAFMTEIVRLVRLGCDAGEVDGKVGYRFRATGTYARLLTGTVVNDIGVPEGIRPFYAGVPWSPCGLITIKSHRIPTIAYALLHLLLASRTSSSASGQLAARGPGKLSLVEFVKTIVGRPS